MKVLVANDGSDAAVEAARQGMALLVDGDEVVVMNVADPAPVLSAAAMSGSGPAVPMIDNAHEQMLAAAAEAVARTATALSVAAEQRVELGRPGPVICQFAADAHADVVVVGSRGLGLLRRALLGSTSSYVVHNAPCPVLVVRATNH